MWEAPLTPPLPWQSVVSRYCAAPRCLRGGLARSSYFFSKILFCPRLEKSALPLDGYEVVSPEDFFYQDLKKVRYPLLATRGCRQILLLFFKDFCYTVVQKLCRPLIFVHPDSWHGLFSLPEKWNRTQGSGRQGMYLGPVSHMGQMDLLTQPATVQAR